jgi:glycosyltransferase involved in cell wall biosynthesis
MTSKPLVSILLATRNRVALLRRAISSLRRQTYANLEILVLDDGSADETPKLLDHLATTDSRLRVLRNDSSSGLASALNRLIAESHGDFLARMDDDDLVYPERIERQIAYMQAHRLDVCGTWYRRFAGIRRSVMRPAIAHEAICAELLFQPPLLHPSVMLRREVIERFGGYHEDYPHAEDYELWTRLAPYCRFGNVPEVLMDYTLAARQVSQRYNTAQVASARRIRAEYLSRLAIPHTAAQREVHVRLRSPAPLDDIAELKAAGDWLLELGTHFPLPVNYVFARQWFLCAVRAAGIGQTTYRTWTASQLAKTVAHKKRVLLWSLCQLRLRYRSAPYRWLEPLAGG